MATSIYFVRSKSCFFVPMGDTAGLAYAFGTGAYFTTNSLFCFPFMSSTASALSLFFVLLDYSSAFGGDFFTTWATGVGEGLSRSVPEFESAYCPASPCGRRTYLLY